MTLDGPQRRILAAIHAGHDTHFSIAAFTGLTPWQVNACLSYPNGACPGIQRMPEGLTEGRMPTWTETRYTLTDAGRARLGTA